VCACTHSAHVKEIAMNDKGMSGSVTEKRRHSRTSGKTRSGFKTAACGKFRMLISEC